MAWNLIQSLVGKYKSKKWFARAVDTAVILFFFVLIVLIHARFFVPAIHFVSVWSQL
ncbi:MAG: hypothetical protein JSU70_10915 [Phycisphaerales bacterium]|nr:MAG: hypothetical protein JSU70_10915 [Phycisphaerales bacterium]